MNDYFSELAKDNYWTGQNHPTGTLRRDYLQPIIGYIGNKLIKILTGQRGTGRSMLLRQIAQHLLTEGTSPRNLLYISRRFTDTGIMAIQPDLHHILALYHERIRPIGKIYIFIEEVQNITQWHQFVYHYSQNATNSYELFLTGSGKDLLSPPAHTHLTRSCVYFEVLPYSYTEHIRHTHDEVGPGSYRTYTDTPHLPGMIGFTPPQNIHYLATLKNTILLRDIILPCRIKDPLLLEQLFLHLIRHLSQPLSVNQLVSYFSTALQKSSYETIATYLASLEQSYLIHRVERYQVKTRELLSGSCRYYLNTWSFASLLYPHYCPDAETRLKNQVYLILRRAGYTVHTGIHRNRTIDFVAHLHDRLIYLQCITTLTQIDAAHTLYHTLSSIPDNYEKWVISLDTQAAPSREGILNHQPWHLARLL